MTLELLVSRVLTTVITVDASLVISLLILFVSVFDVMVSLEISEVRVDVAVCFSVIKVVSIVLIVSVTRLNAPVEPSVSCVIVNMVVSLVTMKDDGIVVLLVVSVGVISMVVIDVVGLVGDHVLVFVSAVVRLVLSSVMDVVSVIVVMTLVSFSVEASEVAVSSVVT